MNDLFVNVKVDREERPDVDAVYMEAIQAMTGHGGWPMTVFLDPDGRPFYGGTYFPPDRRGGMPGFVELLPRRRRRVAQPARRPARAGRPTSPSTSSAPASRRPRRRGLPGAEVLDEALRGLLAAATTAPTAGSAGRRSSRSR